jgi:hypothetical protein
MTEYTSAGLVTDDPVIAAGFPYGACQFQKDWDSTRMSSIHYLCKINFTKQPRIFIDERGKHFERICIPWRYIERAIQPIEGEGFVIDSNIFDGAERLLVLPNYEAKVYGHYNYAVHKRVLNIVTTRAELRELVKWAKGEKNDQR